MFTYEDNPIWDKDKERIIGSESNSFESYAEINKPIPYHWWRLNDDETNEVQGYGWVAKKMGQQRF